MQKRIEPKAAVKIVKTLQMQPEDIDDISWECQSEMHRKFQKFFS